MDIVAAGAPGSVSTTTRLEPRVPYIAPTSASEEDVPYVAPDSAVLAAFLASATAGSDRQVYVPTMIPAGSRLVRGRQESGDRGTMGARPGPTVLLSLEKGYLAFYDAVDGSFSNLPGDPCGAVDGRPAISRRVLGGEMVQWEAGGKLHAVYGWGLTRSVVLRVACSMRVKNESAFPRTTPIEAEHPQGAAR